MLIVGASGHQPRQGKPFDEFSVQRNLADHRWRIAVKVSIEIDGVLRFRIGASGDGVNHEIGAFYQIQRVGGVSVGFGGHNGHPLSSSIARWRDSKGDDASPRHHQETPTRD